MFRLDSSHPSGAHGWAMDGVEPVEYVVVPSPGRPGLHLTADGSELRAFDNAAAALDFLVADLVGRPLEAGRPARWVGFLNYDLAHGFEVLPMRAVADPPMPLLVFGRCTASGPEHVSPGEIAAPATGRDMPFSAAVPSVTPVAPEAIPSDRSTRCAGVPEAAGWDGFEGFAVSNFTRQAFEQAVARAIDYIHAGDIFQVNLAQRLTVRPAATARQAYARLLASYPAWYGALLELPPWLPGCRDVRSIVSNSPELFLHVDPNRTVTTRPIKGTRPRLPGMAEALRQSVKDQAELAMIVDLLRNDLGRVCEFGSVVVLEKRTIEAHPTVYHGVSTISGRLKRDVGLSRLLAATFPCGSVTGAPKIRAMQIIDELEPHRRGVYCGAVGYLDARGIWQFNVAIRTIVFTAEAALVSVGGGIVADSVPAEEYDETLVKARAQLAALRPLDDPRPATAAAFASSALPVVRG